METARGRGIGKQLAFLFRVGIIALLSSFSSCRAEIPGGNPIPYPDGRAYEAHGDARVAYFLLTDSYRFQGNYGLTYNFLPVQRSILYAFANVDVEAISSVTQNFQPDRLTGTFELGARHVGTGPLALFLRHRSPHNIDRSDRKQGSWEMIGVRWQQEFPRGNYAVSFGRYIRTIVFDYESDLDLQAHLQVGRLRGLPVLVRADLHGVSRRGNSGFLDGWLEGNVQLAQHVAIFLGGGPVHHIDVFGGKSDTVIQLGTRISW